MTGIPGVPRKSFLLTSMVSGLPAKVTVESHVRDIYPNLPQEALDKLAESGPLTEVGVKVVLPDGTEWFLPDRTVEHIAAAVTESRAYFADGGEPFVHDTA